MCTAEQLPESSVGAQFHPSHKIANLTHPTRINMKSATRKKRPNSSTDFRLFESSSSIKWAYGITLLHEQCNDIHRAGLSQVDSSHVCAVSTQQ